MGNPFSSSKTQTSNSTTNELQSFLNNLTSSSGGTNTVTPNENPLFTSFRESILPAIAQQYQTAQTPVYGAPQEAQFTQQANDIYNEGEQGAANTLARRGVTDSGAADAANTNLEQQRTGQIANFYSQIPMLNEQAKFNQTQNLLGLATSFLGQSPIGQTATGTNTGQQNQTGTSTSAGNQTGTQTLQNNPSIFGDIGSVLGLVPGFGQIANSLGNIFGNNNAGAGQGPGSEWGG